LLPNPALKPDYDKVVWLYVYRDFSKNNADRAAERISIRFGVTSWPQIFLADPASMKILKHTGRTVKTWQRAVGATSVKPQRTMDAYERIRAAEERAKALEKRAKKKAAAEALDDKDIVVRTRALQILEKKDPKVVVKRAVELLKVPNDPFRYSVCAILKDAGDPNAAPALEAIVKNPKPSLNPNVLRIRAVQALGACGDAMSVGVIAPFASSGALNNGLTGVSVDALAAIGVRHKSARKSIDAVLSDCVPPEPSPAADPGVHRRWKALVARIDSARKKIK
jgi:HEAT repeat protein